MIIEREGFTYVLPSPARHHQSSEQSAEGCSYSLNTVIAALQKVISSPLTSCEVGCTGRTLLLLCCDLLLRHFEWECL